MPTTQQSAQQMTKVGEIIEASTAECRAESYTLNQAPPLGSLVHASREDASFTVYGVINLIETRPLDPARKPIARGRDAGTLTAIYDEHPQLKELFRTHFTFQVLGHQTAGALRHYLPPYPLEVHQLVYECEPDQVCRFTEDTTFLPLLLGGPAGLKNDEIAAAFLRQAAAARGPAGRDFLLKSGKEMVRLLQGDAGRLNAILGRLR